MKTVQDADFSGKKVLVRVDFNVPMDGSKNITDDTRILAAKPTIDKLLQDGAAVILMSHLGRPKGKPSPEYSLQPVADALKNMYGDKVQFAKDSVGEEALAKAEALQPGQILLLENLRFHAEEEKGDAEFARKLASLGDAYVNDAFGTAHRAHSSTAVIAENFPGERYFGLLMNKELEAVDKVLKSGEKPVTAIIGGSKVSSKITIIENILPAIDHLIIGGGMAFTFIKALGGKIGNSLVEEDKMTLALEILEKAKTQNVKVHLPVDAVAAEKFENEAKTETVDIYNIPEGFMGLDIGPRSRELFHDVIVASRTILWNGPAGVFEMSNFAAGTVALGDAIAEATKLGAFSLVGGGDSVAFVKGHGYEDKVSYVSTGGGAMLESLEGIELPGIKAIKQ